MDAVVAAAVKRTVGEPVESGAAAVAAKITEEETKKEGEEGERGGGREKGGFT